MQIAAGTIDGNILLLNPDLTTAAKLPRQPGAVTSLSRQENVLLAAVGKGARICDWTRPEAAAVRLYEGHTLPVTSAEFGGEECRWIFTASEDKTLKIWDFRAQGYQMSQTASAPVLAATLNGGNMEIYFGDVDGKLSVWDLTANRVKPQFQSRQAITALGIDKTGDFLMVGLADGGLYVTGDCVSPERTESLISDGSLKPLYVSSLPNDLVERSERHMHVVTRCRVYQENATITMLSSSLDGTVIAGDRKILKSSSGVFDTRLLPSGEILMSSSDGRVFTEILSITLSSPATSLVI